ncbi:MAG: hypothetical protein MK107_06960 [Oceanicola sp.]|nr:hypothetical protein [Oceanicola sp.]
MLKRILVAAALPVLLAGCTAEPVWAPEAQVTASLYTHDGPPSLTLFTVINNRTEAGAHAGLMVNGSHRVIFDPAGTFKHPSIPERNDVHYGARPAVANLYVDYHARETFRVVTQTIEVSPEVAEQALLAVQEYGAVPKARCTVAVTRVLQQLPGFESISTSYFPTSAMEEFAELPGVVEQTFYDNDSDDNKMVLQANL